MVFKLKQKSAYFAAFFALVLPSFGFAQGNVLTYHYDNTRSGWNYYEKILTPANVNSTTFGKLYDVTVDGKVDAQPLVVYPNPVTGGKKLHPAVYVATEHDSLYAIDGDLGTILWQITLAPAGETSADWEGCGDVEPEMGVTGTPVIDKKSGPHGTLYVVAKTKDSLGNYIQRLHAIDLSNGAEEFGGPVVITGTYPGTGDNSSGGNVIFDPKQYKHRASLLLVNGTIYTTWGSICDRRPYTGWVMGYDEATLAQKIVFNFSPNGNDAGIWGSGAGPSADTSGNLFFQLGNGTFDTTLNAQGFPIKGDFGNSLVKATPSGSTLTPLDYWTMYNTAAESSADEDLGSGGVLLLPDVTDATGKVRHLATGAGKDQNINVWDRDNLGKFNPTNNSTIYQQLPLALSGQMNGVPAYFNGSVYYAGTSDVVKQFKITSALFSTTPVSQSSTIFGYPGATPSVTSNGPNNAILWVVENTNPAVLHAYDPNNLATEFYNSNQAPSGRDQFGNGNKFIMLTAVDGRVFVGTPNSLAIFGLIK